MLNAERYSSIAAIFRDKGIQLSDRDVMLYADAFEIIAFFLKEKLSNEEMVCVVDFLSDVITNKAPHVVAFVPKNDRLRVQYPLMEKMAATKDKLTSREKEILAFCVYWMTCVQVYDEKYNTVVSGLVDFKSTGHVLSLYKKEKANRPEFFPEIKIEPDVDKTTYGLSIKNPIRLTSVADEYLYLNRLRFNNSLVEYERKGSCRSENGHMIDVYTLTLANKKFLSHKKVSVELYIDAYSDVEIIQPPAGLSLV